LQIERVLFAKAQAGHPEKNMFLGVKLICPCFSWCDQFRPPDVDYDKILLIWGMSKLSNPQRIFELKTNVISSELDPPHI
jgi:hypothetical protein